MKKIFQAFLQYVLPLALGLGLFWWVMKDQNFSEIVAIFRGADYRWLFASFCFAIISHWARAQRWKLLLEPIGYDLPIVKSFIGVMVGYLANLLVPRMGEVTRCAVVQKMHGIPANVSFGTVVMERIVDVIILFSLVVGVVLLEFDKIGKMVLGIFSDKLKSLQNLYIFAIIGVLLLIIVAFIIYKMREKLLAIPFVVKVKNFSVGVFEGLQSIRKVKNMPLFVFYTLLIWFMYYMMAYVLFFCRPETENLGLIAGGVILVMGGIGMAAPVQGGVGAYHLLVSQALMFYGIEAGFGKDFATFMHTVQTGIVFFVGLLAFLASFFFKKEENKEVNT